MREAGARGWGARAASARTGTRGPASARRPRRPRAGSHAGKPPGQRCSSPWCSSSCCSCRCGCHPSRWKSRTRRMVTCLNCLTSFTEERYNFPRTHPVFHCSMLHCVCVSGSRLSVCPCCCAPCDSRQTTGDQPSAIYVSTS